MGTGQRTGRVIHFNRYVREFGPGEFFDRAVAGHDFVIGSERDQNWFFLDLASGSDGVLDVPPRGGRVRRESESLAEFPAALVEWWENVEADSE